MTDLTNPVIIRGILSRYGFGFSKALGQNFLIDPSVCPRMAEQCGAAEYGNVIEIGPGIGVLTAELAKRADKVVAIELDARLIPVLKETLSGCKNVSVLQGDALTVDLAALIADQFGGEKACVCANLPYYITSPVIMRLLELRLPLTAVTVMVQKEAAARLTADPGTREAGAVSLAVRYYAKPSALFDVSSESFMPRPRVDSRVIRLDVRERPAVEVSDERRLFRIIRAAFNQRRKTILNALSSGLSLSRERTAAALTKAGISLSERGERLTLEDFARLSEVFGDL